MSGGWFCGRQRTVKNTLYGCVKLKFAQKLKIQVHQRRKNRYIKKRKNIFQKTLIKHYINVRFTADHVLCCLEQFT